MKGSKVFTTVPQLHAQYQGAGVKEREQEGIGPSKIQKLEEGDEEKCVRWQQG